MKSARPGAQPRVSACCAWKKTTASPRQRRFWKRRSRKSKFLTIGCTSRHFGPVAPARIDVRPSAAGNKEPQVSPGLNAAGTGPDLQDVGKHEGEGEEQIKTVRAAAAECGRAVGQVAGARRAGGRAGERTARSGRADARRARLLPLRASPLR